MTGRHLVHVTGPLERWDLIAYRYYGDATLYGPILDANRDSIVGLADQDGGPGVVGVIPAVLPPLLELRIPILDGTRRPAPEELPPWFR